MYLDGLLSKIITASYLGVHSTFLEPIARKPLTVSILITNCVQLSVPPTFDMTSFLPPPTLVVLYSHNTLLLLCLCFLTCRCSSVIVRVTTTHRCLKASSYILFLEDYKQCLFCIVHHNPFERIPSYTSSAELKVHVSFA